MNYGIKIIINNPENVEKTIITILNGIKIFLFKTHNCNLIKTINNTIKNYTKISSHYNYNNVGVYKILQTPTKFYIEKINRHFEVLIYKKITWKLSIKIIKFLI